MWSISCIATTFSTTFDVIFKLIIGRKLEILLVVSVRFLRTGGNSATLSASGIFPVVTDLGSSSSVRQNKIKKEAMGICGVAVILNHTVCSETK